MIRPDASERFGLLSEAIQVKGAISLADITREGMVLDLDRLTVANENLRRRLDGQVAELAGMPRCEALFHRDRDRGIVLTSKGQAPSLSQKVLRDLLAESAAVVAEDTGRPFPIPRTAKGNISLKARDWEEIAPFDPFIAAWTGLVETTKALQSFGGLDGATLHPRYATLVRTGRTSCSGPNIQNLPRKGGFREAFVPRQGYLFLIVDYSYIELRTLAAECEARYGRSTLADVIRAGIDPHCYTAAMFEGMGLDEFMALKSGSPADRERFDVLRQRAKVINFGIPGGLGARALVGYARSTYGVKLTLEEAAEFRDRLIHEVYPELGLYLADDGMDALARNLGASVEACWARFDRQGDRSGAVVGGIRRVARGESEKADGQPYKPGYLKRIWDGLIGLNRDGELTTLLARRRGDEALFRRLFFSGITTLTGRIRGRVGFTQARNTPFQGLAADGAKLALWDLTRAGYRVMAFIHDEVVIELPEDADHAAEATRVEAIMNRAMERVTGDVPVACEYALARRWSKKARAIFDAEGRLVPWDEAPE